MRKITEQIANAFRNGHSMTKDNTRTDGNAIYLFGNKIVERRDDGIYVCDGGFPLSNTTKERLKPFANVSTRKGVDYIADIKWDGSWICIELLDSRYAGSEYLEGFFYR